MAELTTQDMAALLLAEGFRSSGPVVPALSDPIADTPVVVTLDELLPYDLNPRITRNPLYDDIKDSIRKRGLDAPPAITRRPGEKSYMIRSGGNTRLAILRELWSETRDEQFFRIHCLYRPWPERGEIIALTGHLAEGELHGRLTFIEKALGIEKARELYERESNQTLSQSELARRLTADGYPISQPHISRMQDAVRYLLPAIPSVLFGGLGRPQVEKLVTLRNAALRTWETQATSKQLKEDFTLLFHDVLTLFDDPEKFTVQRLQDELVGQMADRLNADYDELMLQIEDSEAWQRALGIEPQKTADMTSPLLPQQLGSRANPEPVLPPAGQEGATRPLATETLKIPVTGECNTEPFQEPQPLQSAVISPAATTERLQSLQQLVAEHSGEIAVPGTNTVQSLPVQTGSLYPISNIWLIEPGLDTPNALRTHINQLALEIALEADVSKQIETTEGGIGYHCTPSPTGNNTFGHTVLSLLSVLSQGHLKPVNPSPHTADPPSATDISNVLIGTSSTELSAVRLSDTGMVKLFRLIRLARRLFELMPVPEPHTQGLSDF